MNMETKNTQKRSVKAVPSKRLSTRGEDRFVIIDEETGEILDDAQGYGYKSIRKAYAAYGYKTRDKSKDREKTLIRGKVRKWMKAHKSFVNFMDEVAFEIAKGSWGPDDKFDAKLVRQMLKNNNLEIDFRVSDLLKVWRNGY